MRACLTDDKSCPVDSPYASLSPDVTVNRFSARLSAYIADVTPFWLTSADPVRADEGRRGAAGRLPRGGRWGAAKGRAVRESARDGQGRVQGQQATVLEMHLRTIAEQVQRFAAWA